MTPPIFSETAAGIHPAIARIEEQLRLAEDERKRLKAELKKYRKMLALHNEAASRKKAKENS